MNHREEAQLEVLAERVANLIARVDNGFADMGIEIKEQGKKIDQSLNETQRLGIRMDKVETTLSDHMAIDQMLHAKVGEHLESHKRREYSAEGKHEAMAWIDKVILRYLVPAGMLGYGIYNYIGRQ